MNARVDLEREYYRDNGSEDWLFIYTFAGKGEIHCRDAEFFCEPGDAICYSPGVYHDYGIAKGAYVWEIAWAHFYPWPHWTALMSWPSEVGGVRRLSVREEETRARIVKQLQKMARLAQSPDQFREIRAMNLLEQTLLTIAGECRNGKKNASSAVSLF